MYLVNNVLENQMRAVPLLLNPCDFFLWGYLKSKVYTPKPANLDQLEQNIINEINAIPPAMIRRALLDVRKRALKVIANNGGYCEG